MGMNGESRRQKIIAMLEQEKEPVSGETIAKKMGVSRQVIVQDIALLRTAYPNIFATNRGYLLYQEPQDKTLCERVIKVRHGKKDIIRELDTIVDAGGQIVDVMVEHEIYGRLVGKLLISNRAEVREFAEKVERNQTKPLTELTKGVHFHTIRAKNEEILDRIEAELRQAGFLCE